MSRYATRALVGAAGLALSATAFGQTANPVHPIFTNSGGNTSEVVNATNSGMFNVVIELAGTTDPAAVPADGDFKIRFFDDMGAQVGADVVVPAAAVTITDDNGDAGEAEAGDEVQLDLTTILPFAPITAVEFGILHGPDADAELTDGTAMNEAANTRYSLNRNVPTFTSALFDSNTMDPTMSDTFLVFSVPTFTDTDGDTVTIPMKQADGAFNTADNPNDTDAAILNNTDFEVDTTGTFPAPMALDATGINSFAIADGDVFITANFDEDMNADLDDTGKFIRVTAATGRIFDATGVRPTASGPSITTKVPFAATGASWLTDVPDGSGVNGSALAVDFNGPVNGGAFGDTAFFDNLLVGGEMTDLVVDGVVGVDPDNPNRVLLDVEAPGFTSDGVDPNGLLNAFNNDMADNGTFSIDLDDMTGTPPDDIFGDTFEGTQGLDIGDEINPSNIGAIKYYDKDGDGNQDALGLVFDESLGAGDETGITLRKVGGTTVNPIAQINANTGELVDDEIEAADDPADDEIAVTDVILTSTDVDADGVIGPDETNNTLQFCFDPATVDWDNDGDAGADDSEEATPGTGDDGACSLEYDDPDSPDDITIEDANGNTFTSAAVGPANATDDCASPVFVHAFFFTGDNQAPGSNDQLFYEVDGGGDTSGSTNDLGDEDDNNRATLCFSEDVNLGGLDEERVQFGTSGGTFDGANSFTSNNCATLFDPFNPDFAAGDSIFLASGNGIDDGNGNEPGGNATSNGGLLEDKVAPYVPFIVGVDGGVFHNALSMDNNDNGFVEQAILSFTGPLDPATLNADHFNIPEIGGAPTAVMPGADDSLLIVDFTDSLASNANPVGIQYQPATNMVDDADLLAGANGNPVANADQNDLEADFLPTANIDNYGIRQMPVVGTIANAPRGSKVYALIAVPSVKGIYATHNNVRFFTSGSSSTSAWNNYLWGIEKFVYLNRNDDNDQIYVNSKSSGNAPEHDDANAFATYDDTVWINRINANNLENVTFQGVGETRDDKVTQGELMLGWDVLRGGSLSSLFRNGAGNSTPIRSSTVLEGDDGSFTMHVGAPTFAGRGNDIIGDLDLPVIFICETPDGTRHALSSLLTSADFTNHAGAAIMFRDHKADDDGGSAFEATRVDFDLANVGTTQIREGWNTEGFNRNSGWAERNNNVPELANGMIEDNIVIGSDLPNVDPLDQFVFWDDSNADGVWDVLDSSTLNDIYIDLDCVDSTFAFTCTSFGPQFGDGMTNLVGGYGFAIFNDGNDDFDIGCFQFGAELANTVAFGEFPNNNSTAGWGLITNQVTQPAADILGVSGVDYIIVFDNISGDTNSIRVQSAATNGNNPNDLETVQGGEAMFTHFEN